MVREGPCDVMACLFELEEVVEDTESIRKAGHYKYKNEGKVRDQTTLFPGLRRRFPKGKRPRTRRRGRVRLTGLR